VRCAPVVRRHRRRRWNGRTVHTAFYTQTVVKAVTAGGRIKYRIDLTRASSRCARYYIAVVVVVSERSSSSSSLLSYRSIRTGQYGNGARPMTDIHDPAESRRWRTGRDDATSAWRRNGVGGGRRRSRTIRLTCRGGCRTNANFPRPTITHAGRCPRGCCERVFASSRRVWFLFCFFFGFLRPAHVRSNQTVARA